MFVDVKELSGRFIDAHIRLAPGDPLVHVTFVYGEPRVENRHRMWSHLTALRASSTLPWLVVGDFNEVQWQYEHFSANLRAEAQMAAFRDCLQLCELNDLGFSGLPFTYDNKRAGSRNIRVRLDRAVADNSWRDIYSETEVVHLVSPCSDHSPLLVKLEKEVRPALQRPVHAV
jgi:endonuclease/exonuclease/phosphatase family metal-dependent hydrolase